MAAELFQEVAAEVGSWCVGRGDERFPGEVPVLVPMGTAAAAENGEVRTVDDVARRRSAPAAAAAGTAMEAVAWTDLLEALVADGGCVPGEVSARLVLPRSACREEERRDARFAAACESICEQADESSCHV